MMKVGRDAFLYMDPQPPAAHFAQCATCRQYLPLSSRCALIGVYIRPNASCGLYVHGEPVEEQRVRGSVSAEAAGYVEREVRCENCKFFDPGYSSCGLYSKLNNALPVIFDLDTKVHRHGCCNAQTPRDDWRSPRII